MIDTQQKVGVLLVNLGSPQTCTVSDIRRFLGEFLTDPYVITLKSPFRQILFKGIVAPLRAKKILEKYAAIWGEDGRSPLYTITESMVVKLQQLLPDNYTVLSTMRYGAPNIMQRCKQLTTQGIDKLYIVPLFPQSAKETTGSIEAIVNKSLRKYTSLPEPIYVNDYFAADYFIDALKALYAERLADFKADKILWSYHGLPNQSVAPYCQQSCKEGGWQKPCHAVGQFIEGRVSCYRAQCFATSNALNKALAIDNNDSVTVFQSRFGPLKWVGPGLLTTLDALAVQGIKRVAVGCPSFVTDCLETLEEVNMAAREYWLEKGGEDLLFLPCVNDQQLFIAGLAKQVCL